MTVKAYPGGFGGVTGSILATGSPSYLLGSGREVFYVDSVNGSDSNTGVDRRSPVATLSKAITDGVSGDLIICLAGHTETFSSQLVINKGVNIIGEGSAGGVPTVTFNSSLVATDMFSVTNDNTSFHNIKFPVPTVSTTGYKVNVENGVDNVTFDGCYFELNDFDTVGAMRVISHTVSSGSLTLNNTTFISTSTTVTGATRPGIPIFFSSTGGTASAYPELNMDGLILDGGLGGFQGGIGVESSEENIPISSIRGTNISMLNGADFSLNGSSSGYIVNVTATGGSVISV